MTNANVGSDKKPIIPSITGFPMLDTAIRVLLTSACAAITAAIVTWLAAHGYKDQNIDTLIGGAVMTGLVGAATVSWSLIQTQLNKNSVVQHTVEALATGNVSEAVKVAAMASPKLSDEILNKAADNATRIKDGK